MDEVSFLDVRMLLRGRGGEGARRVGTGWSWEQWGLQVGELKPPLAILGNGAPAAKNPFA